MSAAFTVPATRYPATTAAGLAGALADAPITLDGMTVQFDERVPLYPVTLKPAPGEDADVEP